MKFLYFLYKQIAYTRRILYEKNILKKKYLKRPVISVGNLTFGGSGKTPFVIRLGKELIDKGLKVSILSRGYGRKSKGLVPISDGVNLLTDVGNGGDEPFLISKNLPKAIVTCCEDRFLAGKFAEEENNVDIHILDDGFQHYKLFRDFDILMVKNNEKFKNKEFREPLKSIKKANYIIFVNEYVEYLKKFLEINLIPFLKLDLLNYGFFSKDDKPLDLKWIKENEWIALSGIESNFNFFRDLLNYQIPIKSMIPYPDHYYPSKEDLKKIDEEVKRLKVKGIITTQKDIYKWEGNFEIIYHKVGFPPLNQKLVEKIIRIYERKTKN